MDEGVVGDTWHNRDLPVLRAVVKLLDDSIGRPVRVGAIEETVGLDKDDVQRALNALASAALIDTEGSWQTRHLTVSRVTGEARTKAGAWPTPDTALDRMIAALEAIAANTDDEDTRTRARKILDGFAGAGRQIGITAAGAALGGQIPGA